MHEKRTMLTCAHCGTSFPYKQSGRKQHQFCTWACLQASRTPEARFWSKVDQDGPPPPDRPDLGSCWVWTGALFAMSGYGQFWLNDTNRRAHIVSYEWANGPTNGQQVQHLCNVRVCVRPSHLTLGTPAENMGYAVSMGRMARGDRHWLRSGPDTRAHARGERNGSAKLTADGVRAIKASLSNGEACAQIAARYGVSDAAVRDIKRGRNWRHVV